jgi:hypothetical protein
MKTKEKQREYNRRYRERNLEARREDNRKRLAEHRQKNAHLNTLEAVTNVDAFWSRVSIKTEAECWDWTGARTNRGYGVYAPLPGVLLRTHRVAYALHNGSIDESLFVCHKCDNPSCCNPAHLFLGTPKDNVKDMISKGRGSKSCGESHSTAKLTREQVRAIFQDFRTNREIAADYKIAASYASIIRSGKTRSKDTDDLPRNQIRKTGVRLTNTQLQALTT